MGILCTAPSFGDEPAVKPPHEGEQTPVTEGATATPETPVEQRDQGALKKSDPQDVATEKFEGVLKPLDANSLLKLYSEALGGKGLTPENFDLLVEKLPLGNVKDDKEKADLKATLKKSYREFEGALKDKAQERLLGSMEKMISKLAEKDTNLKTVWDAFKKGIEDAKRKLQAETDSKSPQTKSEDSDRDALKDALIDVLTDRHRYNSNPYNSPYGYYPGTGGNQGTPSSSSSTDSHPSGNSSDRDTSASNPSSMYPRYPMTPPASTPSETKSTPQKEYSVDDWKKALGEDDATDADKAPSTDDAAASTTPEPKANRQPAARSAGPTSQPPLVKSDKRSNLANETAPAGKTGNNPSLASSSKSSENNSEGEFWKTAVEQTQIVSTTPAGGFKYGRLTMADWGEAIGPNAAPQPEGDESPMPKLDRKMEPSRTLEVSTTDPTASPDAPGVFAKEKEVSKDLCSLVECHRPKPQQGDLTAAL